MLPGNPSGADEGLERVIGTLLRVGVILAALVVLLGGVFYLARYGATLPHYRMFSGEPADLRSVPGILREVIAFRPRGVIQFGLLLLIATPVARVAISIFAFALRKDRLYVIVTLIVFSLLLYSLSGGGF